MVTLAFSSRHLCVWAGCDLAGNTDVEFCFFSPFLLLPMFCPPFMLLPAFIFCCPQWFRVGRLYSLRTEQSKAEWGLLGLCQSQGSDWRYKSGWKDGGSWILSVWPQFNTRSPIKRDAPDRSITPLLPPDSTAIDKVSWSIVKCQNKQCLWAWLTLLMCTFSSQHQQWQVKLFD